MKKNLDGFGRLLPALRYSVTGLRAAWRHEAAFRQEVVVGLPLIAATPWLDVEKWQLALLVGVILLVWVVELLNSGLEALCDAISTDSHPLLGRAKDLGSAAVFVSIVMAVGIWVWVLVPS